MAEKKSCFACAAEVEEMKQALEEQMRRNQEELEEMKKSYEERMKDSQTASAVSACCLKKNKTD